MRVGTRTSSFASSPGSGRNCKLMTKLQRKRATCTSTGCCCCERCMRVGWARRPAHLYSPSPLGEPGVRGRASPKGPSPSPLASPRDTGRDNRLEPTRDTGRGDTLPAGCPPRDTGLPDKSPPRDTGRDVRSCPAPLLAGAGSSSGGSESSTSRIVTSCIFLITVRGSLSFS